MLDQAHKGFGNLRIELCAGVTPNFLESYVQRERRAV
jgi:hypothetical protein